MPDFEGFEVLNKLRFHLQDRMPRVVFITADATEKTTMRSKSVGIFDFISKPFNIRDLMTVIFDKKKVHYSNYRIPEIRAP